MTTEKDIKNLSDADLDAAHGGGPDIFLRKRPGRAKFAPSKEGWNIEQGSAWTIEQGSAWTIEEGSAIKDMKDGRPKS